MPINNKEFKRTADIYITGRDEIDFRNSVSRAYYAGYHEAENLFTIGLATKRLHIGKNRGVHQTLIDNLKRNSNSDIRKVGELLQQCKNERHVADYKLDVDFIKNRAIVVSGLVEEIFQDFKSADIKS